MATDAEDAPSAPVLFVGGCDLEQAVAFLAAGERVTTHFNYSPADRPRLIVHRDSIDYLLADEWPAGARETVAREAPFIDDLALVTPHWAAFEHVVYSPLIDYVQAKYARDDLPGVYLSFGDVLTPAIDDAMVGRFADRAWTRRHFARSPGRGARSRSRTTYAKAQLERLFTRMAGARSVTVLLGAADTFDGLDADRIAHHRHANEIVTGAAAGFPNVEVVAVDPLLRSRVRLHELDPALQQARVPRPRGDHRGPAHARRRRRARGGGNGPEGARRSPQAARTDVAPCAPQGQARRELRPRRLGQRD